MTRLKTTEPSFGCGGLPCIWLANTPVTQSAGSLSKQLNKSTLKELQNTVKALRFLNPMAVTLCPSKFLPVDAYHNLP